MRISYEWLKEFVDIKKSPAELADDLSLFGHEVDSIKKQDDNTILDFEITPNRGDCLSILGMVREVAALYELKVKSEKLKVKIKNGKIDKNINIKIADPKICPRFTARIIDNIKIQESPKWMQERLKSYGFRPINNIVDITNYVMVATGQPLHAFDYDKIKAGLMNVRLSKKGEEVTTLDGKNRILPENAIIIEDSEKIYDLPGIMGGIKSEVDEKTKTIVLQGAIFDPVLIRLASKYLNHMTDASYRYERGVDFEGTVQGVNMAAELIIETCKATCGDLIDIISLKEKEIKIAFETSKINRLLGTNFSEQEIKNYLYRFGIACYDNIATIPTYRRFDLKIWQDIAEEVARIFGYNNLGKSNFDPAETTPNKDYIKREYIKDKLKEIGFTEIYSYSFTDEKSLQQFGFSKNDVPEIEKPISPETQYLRPSLIIPLLKAAAKNPWAPEINIFEIEKVFSKDKEWWELGVLTSGNSDVMLKKVCDILNVPFKINDADKNILEAYKIRRPIKYLILKIGDINIDSHDYSLEISENKYRPISRFAPTIRDLAFIIDATIDSQDVEKTILEASNVILLVELFDEFVSDKFGQNKKNLAYHIWLQDLEKPVDDQKANKIIENIIKKIEDKFNAKLRS